MIPSYWLLKPYYSLDAYCKQTYGEKCFKISLNTHLGCPNRDGTIGNGGCIFCSEGGSGDFALPSDDSDLSTLITTAIQKQQEQTGKRHPNIAYFQAYTNTYGPVSRLRSLYLQALNHPGIIGISIATRPDCLGHAVLTLLHELKISFPDKLIWIELGLQTIHESTATFINRGYALPVFEKACFDLNKIGIPFIVHIIIGLPYETEEMIYKTCEYLNHIPIQDTSDWNGKPFMKPFGVKLQLLHILKNTTLGTLYQTNALDGYAPLSKASYISILIHCLELLSQDIVIHRVTGDGPKDLLLAPSWSTNKKDVLNTLHMTMHKQQTYQGRCFHDTGTINTI